MANCSDVVSGAAVAVGALLIIVAAILAAVFPKLVDVLLNREIALRDGGRTFDWWREPPVTPQLSVYIYNVTNADEFLNDGEKPVLQELGPYVYQQHWEKVEVKFNENDTVSYKVKKQFVFSPVRISAFPGPFDRPWDSRPRSRIDPIVDSRLSRRFIVFFRLLLFFPLRPSPPSSSHLLPSPHARI